MYFLLYSLVQNFIEFLQIFYFFPKLETLDKGVLLSPNFSFSFCRVSMYSFSLTFSDVRLSITSLQLSCSSGDNCFGFCKCKVFVGNNTLVSKNSVNFFLLGPCVSFFEEVKFVLYVFYQIFISSKSCFRIACMLIVEPFCKLFNICF